MKQGWGVILLWLGFFGSQAGALLKGQLARLVCNVAAFMSTGLLIHATNYCHGCDPRPGRVGKLVWELYDWAALSQSTPSCIQTSCNRFSSGTFSVPKIKELLSCRAQSPH